MIRAENALKINTFHEERNSESLCRQEASTRRKEHFKNNCLWKVHSPLQLMPSGYPRWDKAPPQEWRTSNLILHDISISILICKILMKWILREQIFIIEKPCQNKLAWRESRKTLDWIIQNNLIIRPLSKLFRMHLGGVRDPKYCSFH